MKLVITIVAELEVDLENYQDGNNPVTTLNQVAEIEGHLLAAGETSLDDLLANAEIISTTIAGKIE